MGARETFGSVYVWMATWFIFTAIASFAPTSLGLVFRVLAGEQSSPPLVVHFHAASMSLWLLLLLAQSLLVSSGKPSTHRKLGLASLVLAPCLFVSMYGMDLYGLETFSTETTVVGGALGASEQAAAVNRYVASILLIHGASYLLFPVFYLWAILVRRTDTQTHRRMMILATLVLMIPGLGRLLSVTSVLPDFGLTLIDARHFYLLVLIAPALAYDFIAQRRLHRGYLIGMSLLGGWIVAAHYLWSSALWLAYAPGLLGVA